MPALTLTRLNGHYPVFAAFKPPFRTVQLLGHSERSVSTFSERQVSGSVRELLNG